MQLRPYQLDAVEKALAELRENNSTLVVMATGLGKTVVFSEIIRRMQVQTSIGTFGERAMVVAHREELISQAADKIERITGDKPEIEMAGQWADTHMFKRASCVISSIQTQNAGQDGKGRMSRFKPDQFGLLVIDEAHHAVANSYKKAIQYFQQNKKLKVLGVTATPDRTDEEALGQIFDSVAFVYELPHAVNDGWLVNPQQQSVIIEDLDFSNVRTTAGDLNGRDLADLMEEEKTLQAIAGTTIREAAERKTLVFCASLAQAERTCEIFNRHKPGSSRWVHGGTPKEDRRSLLKDYAERKFQYLVNVGVATEGFDDPGIECIAVGRPTKSRALYCQMVGRGTRPVPGVVDAAGMETSGARLGAIAASTKPNLLVLDFEGNAGRHRLISVIDIMAGKFSDEAVEKVRKAAANSTGPMDVLKALDDTEQKMIEARKKQAERQRQNVLADVKYKLKSVDPFDVFDIEPERARGWDNVKKPSARMVEVLTKHGIETEGRSFKQCQQLIQQIINRSEQKLCTFKQAKFLRGYGVDTTNMTFDQASQQISQVTGSQGRTPYKARKVGEAA